MCKKLQSVKYSPEATIKCQENKRLPYKIEILAVPCDGNIECENGIDERCELDPLYIIITALVLYGLICFAWIFNYNTAKHDTRKNLPIVLFGEGDAPKQNENIDCTHLKGDALAELKVSNSIIPYVIITTEIMKNNTFPEQY